MAHTLVTSVLKNPDEPKFRKIRTTNPAIASKLLSVAGARELLAAAGFRPVGEGGEFLEMPLGQTPSALVLAAIEAVLRGEDPAAAEARRKELEASRLRREAEAAERRRMLEEAKADQAARRAEAAMRGPVASHARALPSATNGGATMKGFRDIGVDVNAGGG